MSIAQRYALLSDLCFPTSTASTALGPTHLNPAIDHTRYRAPLSRTFLLNTPRTLAHNQPRTHQLAHQRHHQLTAHTPPPPHTHTSTQHLNVQLNLGTGDGFTFTGSTTVVSDYYELHGRVLAAGSLMEWTAVNTGGSNSDGWLICSYDYSTEQPADDFNKDGMLALAIIGLMFIVAIFVALAVFICKPKVAVPERKV
jgi:hypothetical protein